MAKSKIAPLYRAYLGNSKIEEFQYEVIRSSRKTLALYIKEQKVVVRCPSRASKIEIKEFVSKNRSWIEDRLLEERLLQREVLKIEQGKKIFFRARELTITFKEGRKKRILIDGNKFIIQNHRLTPAKAKIQVEEYLI